MKILELIEDEERRVALDQELSRLFQLEKHVDSDNKYAELLVKRQTLLRDLEEELKTIRQKAESQLKPQFESKRDFLKEIVDQIRALMECGSELSARLEQTRNWLGDNTIRLKTTSLRNDLELAEQEFRSASAHLSFLSDLEEFGKCWDAVEKCLCGEAIGDLRLLLRNHQQLKMISERLNSSLSNNSASHKGLLDFVRRKIGTLDGEISALFQRVFDETFTISTSDQSVSLRIDTHGRIELSDLVGMIRSAAVSDMIQRINSALIEPVFECRFESLDFSSSEITGKFKNNKTSVSRIDFEEGVRNAQLCLDFLTEKIPLHRDQIMKICIRSNQETIKNILISLLPEKYSELAGFEEWISQLSHKYPDILERPATKTLDRLDNEYLRKMKSRIILQIHSFMNPKKIDSVLVVETAPDMPSIKQHDLLFEEQPDFSFPILSLPTCRISSITDSFWKVIEQVMQDALNFPNRNDLVKTIVDCIHFHMASLYFFIEKQSLNSIPQQAAVFSNDFMYLSHQVLLIACKSASVQDLKHMLFSTALQAQSLSNTIFQTYFNTRFAELISILHEGTEEEYLMGMYQHDRRIQLNQKMKQVRHSIQVLVKILRPSLPLHVYAQWIGCLLEALFGEISKRLLSMGDLRAEECQFLVSILTNGSLKNAVKYEDKIEPVGLLKSIVEILPKDMPQTHSMHRLERILFILDTTLADIETQFFSGYFDGFLNQQELASLIRAVFSDSKKRGETIDSISLRRRFSLSKSSTILCEYSSASGNFSTAAQSILEKIDATDSPKKQTLIYDRYLFHYIVDKGGLVFMCMAEDSFGRRVPFAFLDDLKDDFLSRYAHSYLSHGKGKGGFDTASSSHGGLLTETDPLPYSCNEYSKQIAAKISFYSTPSPEADKIRFVKGEIDQVKSIMVQNIEKVLERGERIEILVDKTDSLNQAAFQFKKQSTRLKKKMWWQNMKLMVILAVTVLIFVYFGGSAACGFPAWQNCLN